MTPRARLHSSGRGTLEHGWPVHRGAFERGHQSGAVLVTRVCLHAAVAREAGTAPPLQLRHRFVSHFVERFVKQTIPEEERNKSPVSGVGGVRRMGSGEQLVTHRRVGHFCPQEQRLYSAFT